MIRRLLVAGLSCAVLLAQTAAEFHRQAAELIRQHQWEEALSLLRSGLEQYPDDPRMLTQTGSLLVRAGHLEEGERLLGRALQLQPEDTTILREMGEARLRRGETESAMELFQRALKGGSEDAESHHRLAFAQFSRGEEPAALENARRAVEIDPLEPRYRRLYALLLQVQGRPRESDRELRLAYQLTPRDPKLLFQLGQRRRLEGALFQALEYLELAMEEDPENPLYHSELARVYGELGETEEAEAESARAQALEAAFDRYLEALRLSSRGRRREAVALLEPVVSRHPEFVTGSLLLADLYHEEGRQDEAFRHYLQVLRRDPAHAAAREKGAWIQVRRGFLDSALKLLEGSAAGTSNRDLIAGYQRMIRADWTGALAHFHQAERRYPLHPGLLQLIAFCLGARNQTEEAIGYLRKAEKMRPGDPQIRLQRLDLKRDQAYGFFNRHHWKEALQRFQELMREDEVRVEYLLHMAYCHQRLGNLEEAVRGYRTALEIDPGAGWARLNLASTLYLMGRYQQALPEWEHLLREAKTPENYYRLGLCYAHLDRFPEAERVFQQAFELGNERPEVIYNLGLARLHNKKPGAWPLIRRAAASGYPPARDLLGRTPH